MEDKFNSMVEIIKSFSGDTDEINAAKEIDEMMLLLDELRNAALAVYKDYESTQTETGLHTRAIDALVMNRLKKALEDTHML